MLGHAAFAGDTQNQITGPATYVSSTTMIEWSAEEAYDGPGIVGAASPAAEAAVAVADVVEDFPLSFATAAALLLSTCVEGDAP